MFLNGEEIAAPDEKGQRILDESFLLLFNAHHEDVTFTLPNRRFGERWALVLSTDGARRRAELARGRRARGDRGRRRARWCCCGGDDRLRATYRLQLGGDFGFAAARELVPYLADLGVSHLYLPPSFQARPGSTHGYDVVDPTSISEELGGEAEFRALVGAAREAGLGVILDIVPNHMAADDANRYWGPSCARSSSTSTRRPAGTGASSTSTTSPACARRTRRCSRRRTGWRSRWCATASVDGLRIDHPDGLADPAGYLERLRDAGVEHVWVEKILDPGEQLRRRGRWRARSATSSSTTWRRCSSTPPARRR